MEEHNDRYKSTEIIEYLKVLTGIITRLNGNSFAFKGWLITILSALLVLGLSKEALMEHPWILFALTAFFWWCDSYYHGIASRFIDHKNRFVKMLNEDNDNYRQHLFKFPPHSKCQQLKGSIIHLKDLDNLVFYLFTIGLLMLYVANYNAPEKTVEPDVIKHIEQNVQPVIDSIAERSSRNTVLLDSTIHILNTTKASTSKSSQKSKLNACYRYRLVNVCEDTIVKKSNLKQAE